MKAWIVPLVLTALVLPSCSTTHNRATTDNPALFRAVATDYGLDLFVDSINGEAASFGLNDEVLIDAGSYELEIRMEYEPAAGTSLLVGGWGNMMLRAGTPKWFPHHARAWAVLPALTVLRPAVRTCSSMLEARVIPRASLLAFLLFIS